MPEPTNYRWYLSTCFGAYRAERGLEVFVGREGAVARASYEEILGRIADDSDVVAVHDIFLTQQASGELLPLLGEHSSIQELGVGVFDESVTTPDLQFLSTLPELRALNFTKVELDSEDFAAICQLENLHVLKLNECRFTDGLHLEGSPLVQLTVTTCHLEVADVRQIASIRTLAKLSLSDSNIDDEGMTLIADLPSVESLTIPSPELSISGLNELGKMESLSNLGIRGPLPPGGIDVLGGLLNLDELRLYDASITNDELVELQSRLPDVRIATP